MRAKRVLSLKALRVKGIKGAGNGGSDNEISRFDNNEGDEDEIRQKFKLLLVRAAMDFCLRARGLGRGRGTS